MINKIAQIAAMTKKSYKDAMQVDVQAVMESTTDVRELKLSRLIRLYDDVKVITDGMTQVANDTPATPEGRKKGLELFRQRDRLAYWLGNIAMEWCRYNSPVLDNHSLAPITIKQILLMANLEGVYDRDRLAIMEYLVKPFK